MPTADAAQRHDRRHLTAVRDIATAVGSRLDFPSVLAAIIERVCALLDCERASLFVIDEDGAAEAIEMDKWGPAWVQALAALAAATTPNPQDAP